MNSHTQRVFCLFAMLGCFALPGAASSYPFGTNLGQLNYTRTGGPQTCSYSSDGVHFITVTYYAYTFSGFSYSNAGQGINQPISGSISTITNSPGPGTWSTCPANNPTGSIPYSGNAYSLTITAGGNSVGATILIPGFLKPKFVIAGVLYAPPGSASTVTYGADTVTGNSATVTSSFSVQNTTSISGSSGFKIFGFGTSETSTYSNSFTEEQDTATSLAIKKTTSSSEGLNGYADPVHGINHDFDQILVWLNPILKFTVTNNNQILWTGYDYDLNDTAVYPDMDVAAIKMGCLNGDFQGDPNFANEWTTCQSVINNRFSRNWALNNVDGSGPALTGPGTVQGTDLYKVLHADPYSDPNYTLVFASGSITTTDGRFTACSNSGCNTTINYYPYFFQTYSQGYTVTTAQSQTAKNIYQMTYGLDTQYSAGLWRVAFTQDLKNSTTITITNQFDQATNNSNGQSASFVIQGPPPGYSGPTAFVVFQDNLYGTFMFH